jgi:hypothetical protein
MALAARLESHIQKQIVDFIAAVLPNAICFAVPNGARRTASGRASNAVPGLRRGAPDLCLCLPGGRVLFIEVKSSNGRASIEQIGFHGHLNSIGHEVFIARSIDDVRLAFKALGIKTREAA